MYNKILAVRKTLFHNKTLNYKIFPKPPTFFNVAPLYRQKVLRSNKMDKNKADKIICEYLPKIYGFAMKKSFYYDEAEELTSEIVAEVYPTLLKREEIYNLDGYIWRMCNHVYAKFVAKSKKQQGISIDGFEIPYEQEFLPDDTEEELRRLRSEIAFLSKVRREIVYSFYYEDRSIAEISKTMDIPDGTVKWHLNKARGEIKKGFTMERKVGQLGIHPVEVTDFGHGGWVGHNLGHEHYLKDKLNLNIVYSVYHNPLTKEEIAEELGITPVFIEERIKALEEDGMISRLSGDRYTTYLCFNPETYSLELQDKILKNQMEAAEILVKEYVPLVRNAVSNIKDVYIPDGNREIFEAAAIAYAVTAKCSVTPMKDLSKYHIKTKDGGDFIGYVVIPSKPIENDYKQTYDPKDYQACGGMFRGSYKYKNVGSWSLDSKYTSREGGWKNNLTEDYEYLYELITGTITNTPANEEKFKRLRQRKFITDDNKINITVMKCENGAEEDFYGKIPELPGKLKRRFADTAMEDALALAAEYPEQMRDLIVCERSSDFISNTVAVMVLDILYKNGNFKPLTQNEKVTSDLIMFSDMLPE